MYPFGSGMPHQPPPPSQSQNNPNTPFGAGCWVPPNPNQAPYSHQSYGTPYPSSNTTYPSQTPYPTHQQSPYPTHQQPPYPPQQNQTAAYPSYGGTPYPPQNTTPVHQTPYPANPGPYPGAHPQQTSSSPYPSFGSGYPPSHHPSSTSSPYPTSTYQSPYPSTNVPYGSTTATANMAQCFNEMRGHNQPIRKGTPTVLPQQNFDPVKDANELRKAMKGFGTDEDSLINVICKRTNAQRQEIQRQYKTHFGKDLIEDVKSETSGNFQKLLVGLLHPIEEFYCMEICDAMSGLGTDEDVLVETFCTLSNSEIHTIKKTYLRMYGAHLESELKSETSGHFKRLLVSLCAGARDESGRTDPGAAVNDARELLNAGELRIGTDESMFNMVLCQRNYEQLKLVFREYENLTGHSLEKAIKREFSGDIMEGLLAIYKCVTNKAEFFASRLHKSMAGIGTNDKQLIRIVVTRCEIDMQDIKNAFEKMYGKSLRSWIKGDTSGDYKHALYALIGENRTSS